MLQTTRRPPHHPAAGRGVFDFFFVPAFDLDFHTCASNSCGKPLYLYIFSLLYITK